MIRFQNYISGTVLIVLVWFVLRLITRLPSPWEDLLLAQASFSGGFFSAPIYDHWKNRKRPNPGAP